MTNCPSAKGRPQMSLERLELDDGCAVVAATQNVTGTVELSANTRHHPRTLQRIVRQSLLFLD